MVDRALTVMSFNIKNLSVDPRAVIHAIRAQGPDVVAVQEPPKWFGSKPGRGGKQRWLGGRSQTRALAATVGMVCVATGGWPGNSGSTALLVSQDLAGQVRTVVKRSLPWKVLWLLPKFPSRRGFCAVDLGPWVVFSVHLGLNPQERELHRNVIAAAATTFGIERCIIAGDLNEAPHGASAAALSDLFTDAAVALGRASPTFPAAQPRRRIDYIFVGSNIAIKDFQVISAEQVSVGSDHLPIVARLG